MPKAPLKKLILAWKRSLESSWAHTINPGDLSSIIQLARSLDAGVFTDDTFEIATNAGAFNADQITGSVYKCAECIMHKSSIPFAIGTAHAAYESVNAWYSNIDIETTIRWTLEVAEDTERNSRECMSEFEFQSQYLSALERMHIETAPSYAEVLKLFDSHDRE